uniref:Reverse transcriptase domain-containing protein n=1 Tax=Tanacetum cinerariifolium TaxID=118510 RepID=A0A6L2LED2_TANCI|nr:reverse transcriptase domain-containing protein [Tanacetum cinerariifolium]
MFKRLKKGVFHKLRDKVNSTSAHSKNSRRRSYYSSRRDIKASTTILAQKKRILLLKNVITKEHPHEGGNHYQKSRIAHEDIGSQRQRGKGRVLRMTYPSHGELPPTKKCIKDPVKIHNIKQRDGESTKEFMQRYKLECRDVKRALECMKISEFMHRFTNPKLIKRLHDKIPKSVDEMIRVMTTFLRGEVAASNHERKKSFPSWKQQEAGQKPNFKKGGFRNQQRSERKQDIFTLLTKTPKEILALDKGKFKPPPLMTTPVEKRNAGKFCEFRGEVEHATDECIHLKRKIKEILKAGKLFLMIQATSPLVGFSGEIIWPLGQISLFVKIGDGENSTSAWMNFMVVRSPSPYNEIIGRPGVRIIYAMLSIAHGMLKFPVANRTVTLQSSRIIPLECMMVSEPEVPQPVINQVTKEKIHPEYPEQTITIGSTLTKEGWKELCEEIVPEEKKKAWAVRCKAKRKLIRECNDYQVHRPVSRNSQQNLTLVTSPWPFYKWGIDIAGPFAECPGKVKFLMVAIDYFTKLIEAKPVATITGAQIKKFVWDNIVCRFSLPGEIISDNGKQFRDSPFKEWCKKLYEGIKARFDERSKNWLEEISHVLWAHHTMIKSSNKETPLSLTYGTKAIIPVEIGMPTLRTAKVDMIKNDEDLGINLDLLEEKGRRQPFKKQKAKPEWKNIITPGFIIQASG